MRSRGLSKEGCGLKHLYTSMSIWGIAGSFPQLETPIIPPPPTAVILIIGTPPPPRRYPEFWETRIYVSMGHLYLKGLGSRCQLRSILFGDAMVPNIE